MAHINIEIKAKCSNKEDIRHIKNILRSKKAELKGTDHQIDTYFKINSGRLKLREGNIENYLIYYDREDKKSPKQSNVMLFKTEPNSPLKKILTKALGILVVVDKLREIYFIKNVKFHMDTVKNLGTFIEIEAMGKEGAIEKQKLLEQCNYFLKLFSIQKKDLVSGSYSDLLLNK